MAFRYFPTRSREWLEARLAELEEELASDKTVTGWTGPDAGATKQKGNASVMQRMQLVLHDLRIIAPSDYPQSSAVTRRTTAIFRDS